MKVSVYAALNRRFVTFVDQNEIPVQPFANAFIYEEFLNASFSTKKRVAYELRLILEYFDSIDINLEKRVSSGVFLTPNEINKFYGQMMLRRESFKRARNISITPSVQNKSIRNAISASIHNSCKVSTETRTSRVRTLRKYLSFLFSHFHSDQQPSQTLIGSFKKMQLKIKTKENYSSTKCSVRPAELVESVIPNDIYEQFLQIIRPSDLKNPFTSSKLRNYLIFSILKQAGLRRSEVCKMKISDCQFYGDFNKIKVYSTPDDKSDPRVNRPDKKSGRPHLSGIEQSLMKEIEFYIRHVRSMFTKAKTHDFIFVSEKDTHNTAGLPITREMVNYMFTRVSKALGFKINPHLLRHKWNENLSEKGESKGFDREYIEDLRRNAMGWQPDSKMGRVYNNKHEQLAAIKLMTEHQTKIDGENK